MKKTLSRIYVGQKLTAKIEEVLEPQEFIVNFQGDLIRVKNTTFKRFVPGENVSLVVIQTKPIAFRIEKSKAQGSFSRSV